SAQEMTYGDGAAALLVGDGTPVATLLGAHSETVDFVDHYRGRGSDFDYAWEERWIRDEGYLGLIPRAIAALLAKTGVAPAAVVQLCLPMAMPRVGAQIAERAGIPAASLADNLQESCGEAGAAHPLLLLVAALERAKPGERILVVGFGQ